MKPIDVYQKHKDRFGAMIEDMSSEEVREIFEDAQKAEMPEIKALPYIGYKSESVCYEFPELTALCPMTALPDTYTVAIEYAPDRFIPELKSLRFYFLAFRDLPITHEHLVDKIRKEFWSAIKPKQLKVSLDVAVRGGIKTTLSQNS